jgi:hypothetical protein
MFGIIGTNIMRSPMDSGPTTRRQSAFRVTAPDWLCIICLLSFAVPGFAENPAGKELVIASATSGFYMPARAASRLDFVNAGTVALGDPNIPYNEAAAVDLCLDYVEAQYRYFRSNYAGDGIPVFAHKIRSSPGKRDGLYWPISAGDDESPLGPNVVAAAATEPHPTSEPSPISGYFVKVLLAQGPAAPGGARDYRVNNRLITGFGLFVWPARYGITGIQSFVVNHLGDVYARDFGPDTNRIAAAIAKFDPDHKWSKVAVHQDSDEALR